MTELFEKQKTFPIITFSKYLHYLFHDYILSSSLIAGTTILEGDLLQ
jgi:hypothetical protein